jgi:pimeloyl-ACP methyl ester carboxylesterase
MMFDRRNLFSLAAGLGATGLAAGPAHAKKAEPPAPAFGRAKNIIANARKIVRPGGIERHEAVRIGGIEQWVSIRGTDPRNPVLLYLHGGPGYVSMPMNWWFGIGWEEYFTVVHWDQRGAGKTYLLNDPTAVAPTLTFARMRDDVKDMASWLTRELGKNKIFVLGHSWGSYLGLQTAWHFPELLHAYIGVGQLTDGPQSERRGWAATLAAARRDGNVQAVHELEAIAPYFAPGKPAPLKDIFVQRKWLDHYGGVMAFRAGNDAESDLSLLSPDYTDGEIAHIWDGNQFSEKPLLAQVLGTDQSDIRRLECPLIVFAGRYDTNVNSDVAADWFGKVDAPEKHFVWFENSAHLPMTEEPGKFLTSLIRYARPIAERAGDAAPA